ncbi:UNVERIFIED_ORG: putative NAD(P)/FAD-binding protein YdhS [Burkholderia sp. 1263]
MADAAPKTSAAETDTSVMRRPATSIAPALRIERSDGERTPIFHVAIIGAGPRGLGVLERVQAMLSQDNLSQLGLDMRVNVHLIEPGEPGRGVHTPDQDEHLLLNTLAGAVTMWDGPDKDGSNGPTLKEWANAQGYRFVGDRFVRDTLAGRAVRDDDYLPRAMLGRYLDDVYRTLEARLDDDRRLRLIHYPLRAVDVKRHRNDRLKVILEGGFPLIVDHAVLAAGAPTASPSEQETELIVRVAQNRRRNALLQFIPSPYPLDAVHPISPEAIVAVRGMGLSSLDVLGELTVGRGGRFVSATDGGLRYMASGNEPRIVLFSRGGLALKTRAVNQRDPGEQFEPQFFTRAAIDELRARKQARTGNTQLDFEADLLLLIEKEMSYAFHCSKERESATDPLRYSPAAHELNVVRDMLFPSHEPAYPDHASYVRAVSERLREDLSRARQGNVDRPSNAAAHVLHDIRDIIRYAVDFGGLTPDSHRRFLALAARMNRASGAVPHRRNEELFALIQAGIVSFGPGADTDTQLDEDAARFVLRSTAFDAPHTMRADVLIHAQLDGFPVHPESSSLYANLLESGLIWPYRNGDFAPGGIDVDPDRHVIDSSGQRVKNLDVSGIATEGPNGGRQ